MLFKFLLAALTLPALLVMADPNPTVPGPGDSYKEGGNCTIKWDADTTGTWTDMKIQLMTGDNYNMVQLKSVTTIDATVKTQYTYKCPNVTPNSAIYFYQFISASSTAKYWTTRFTITDAAGQSTPPTETTQPNGDKIPWGTGSIVNGSSSSSLPASSSTHLSPLPSGSSSSHTGSSTTSSPSSSTLDSSPVPTETGVTSQVGGGIVVAVSKSLVFVAGLVTASTAFFL